MKHLKPSTLAILLIITLLPVFGQQQAVEVQATAQSQTATKLQALSVQLQGLPREERVAFAREAAEGLGLTFLEPNSMEGRTLINTTAAKLIVEIYASNIPLEEKRERSRALASDAGMKFNIAESITELQSVNAQSVVQSITELLGSQSVKNPGKKKVGIQDFYCDGVGGCFAILEGSGCLITCQMWGCYDPGWGFYIECSQTTFICPDGSPHDFGMNCSETCPCH